MAVAFGLGMRCWRKCQPSRWCQEEGLVGDTEEDSTRDRSGSTTGYTRRAGVEAECQQSGQPREEWLRWLRLQQLRCRRACRFVQDSAPQHFWGQDRIPASSIPWHLRHPETQGRWRPTRTPQERQATGCGRQVCCQRRRRLNHHTIGAAKDPEFNQRKPGAGRGHVAIPEPGTNERQIRPRRHRTSVLDRMIEQASPKMQPRRR